MWALPLVFIVLLYRSYGSVDPVQQGREEAKEAILNVTGPDCSCIDVFTRRPYGLFQKIYRAKDGYRISSVVYRCVTLWDGTDGYSCDHVTSISYGHIDTHLSIHLRNDEGKRISLYYEKDGSIWAPIEESTFYSSFHKMVKIKTQVELLTLDITEDQDPEFLYVNKSPKFPFAVYAANSACRIKKVMYGQTNVWEAGGKDEGCLYASFYPRETPIVAYLIIETSDGTEELYYHRVGEEWISALKNEYRLGLYTNGFNESEFTNEVTLDLSNIDKDRFHKHAYAVGDYSEGLLTPLPGYLLTSVMNGPETVWDARYGEYCTYVDVYGKKHGPITLYLLVKDQGGRRRVIYYAKYGRQWVATNRDDYFSLITAGRNSPMDGHKGDGRIIMSSFRNKQGLRIATYASTVDNARGDIILIHGIRSHFMSEFGTANVEWNFEHYDFPVCSYANPFGGYKPPLESDHADMYRHLFENPGMPGEDVLQISSIYQYKGGMIEFLNRMGYNVYGYDHQAQGLSESISSFRCHAKNYEDYVYDLLQFVSIIRRGKFSDASQVYNENTVFQNVDCSRKTILIGYSLGANIAMQAIQEFHRMVDNSRVTSGRPIVDGFIGLSPMLSLENYMDTWVTYAKIGALRIYSELRPNTINSYDKLNKHGESFSNFSRYNDPFFFSGRMTFQATRFLFDACDDVNKEERMDHYPMTLPTLFIHTKDDGRCSVKGPRKMMAKYFKGNQNAKFVELKGTCHYLISYQSFLAILPHLKEWLEQYT